MSFGYFLSDLAMIIWVYPALGGPEYVSIQMIIWTYHVLFGFINLFLSNIGIAPRPLYDQHHAIPNMRASSILQLYCSFLGDHDTLCESKMVFIDKKNTTKLHFFLPNNPSIDMHM